MKPAFALGLLGLVIFAAAGVYYLIPGVYKPFASPATDVHVKHALVFFAVGIVAALAGRFASNSAPSR